MLKRYRIPLIVLVVALVAAGAGLKVAGVVGGKPAVQRKEPLTRPISFTDPFVVNLADTDEPHYVKMTLAVDLEPMTKSDMAKFEAKPAADAGPSTEPTTGPEKLASDPRLRDAVITTVSQFTAAQLESAKGKEDLKRALLQKFDEVAADETPPPPKKGEAVAPHDPTDAPYHISDVFFPDFAIQ